MLIRLYTENNLSEGANIALTSGQTHYLKNVMRKGISDRIFLFNGRDGEWQAAIKSTDKKLCSVVLERQVRAQKAETDLWLLFAPVKNVKINFIAEKAAELGVSVLQPVITRHTIVTRVNIERLRENAIEAAEQCRRLTIPQVKEPFRLKNTLSNWDYNRAIMFCDESGGGKPVKEALPKADKSKKWAVLIGPEGGFSEEEIKNLYSFPHILPVSLGPRILRADTASIAALTCWQEHLGDWQEQPRF